MISNDFVNVFIIIPVKPGRGKNVSFLDNFFKIVVLASDITVLGHMAF